MMMNYCVTDKNFPFQKIVVCSGARSEGGDYCVVDAYSTRYTAVGHSSFSLGHRGECLHTATDDGPTSLGYRDGL
jgi:hypothetical protein